MRRSILLSTVLCVTLAATLAAQPPGGPDRPGRGPRTAAPGMRRGPGPGMPGGMGPQSANPVAGTAEYLLAHTGELRLTDAQVTRLAAIARRAEERRRAMRARMDSVQPECGPLAECDSAARSRARATMRQRMQEMQPVLDRMREQSLADRRDAIAVLTPEQQAMAWERVAAPRTGRLGPGRDGRGVGRRGFAPRRGPGAGGPRLRERRDDGGLGADRRPLRRRGVSSDSGTDSAGAPTS